MKSLKCSERISLLRSHSDLSYWITPHFCTSDSILPMLGQLLPKVYKKIFTNRETTFKSPPKGIVFQMERGTIEGIQRLERKAFICPCVEVSWLYQVVRSSHRCKWLHYQKGFHVGKTPKFFWKQKIMWNTTPMVNSQEIIVCCYVLP